MSKNGNYEKIINFIKQNPRSQVEIWNLLGRKISLQGISNHLQRGVRLRVIGYLGNKVRKTDTKQLLRIKFGRMWSENAHQHYLYTPRSKKFRRRLLRKFAKADEEELNEISRLYQLIEIMTNFQEIHIFDEKLIAAQARVKGRTYTKKELRRKTSNWKKRIKSYYQNRDRNNIYLKFLKMTSLMYWISFKRVTPKDHPDYDKNLDMIETVTKPLLSKIARLDNIKLVMTDNNSVTILYPSKNED